MAKCNVGIPSHECVLRCSFPPGDGVGPWSGKQDQMVGDGQPEIARVGAQTSAHHTILHIGGKLRYPFGVMLASKPTSHIEVSFFKEGDLVKIVNLKRFRKSRVRDSKQALADQNAARHGRTRAEKANDESRVKRLNDHLDNHKRDN